MAMSKIIAIALIVAGVLGLVYGSFTYPTETHQADIGGLSLSLQETDSVAVPVWVGIGAILVGGALLLFGTKFTR